MVSTQGIFRTLLLTILLASSSLAAAVTSPEAVNLYNRACTASLAGQNGEALGLLQQAMQAGFDDLRFAQADPDLNNLTTSKGFQNLLLTHQTRLTLLSSERGMELQSGNWSPWTELESATPTQQAPTSIRLKWQPLGLDYEVRLTGDLAAAFHGTVPPPASGGPSLVFTLAVMDETSAYESANTFHFLLGKNKTSGMGALYLGNGWQPVSELTPEFTSPDKGQSVTMRGTIAWQTILPYHPLVDSTLGLNIAVQHGPSGSLIQTLFPDPQVFVPGAEIHRFVPLKFDLNTVPYEAMVGRMSQSVVSDSPLQWSLKVISAESGTGHLSLNFLDNQGNSVLADGAQVLDQPLTAGLNDLSQSADFSALKTGPYLVKAHLELPSGTVLTWSSLVLNMGPHWMTNLQERTAKLSAKDQPTAQFYLETISTAVSQLKARRHPGSLTTTLLELDTFLEVGQTHGSILPNSGVFILVWNDPQGEQRFCSLYLPVGHRKSDNLEPVVLWADAPGSERRLVTRIGQFVEYPRNSSQSSSIPSNKFPIYLVPHPPAKPYTSLDEEAADVRAFLTWANSYFQTEKTALAGMNAAGGAVLEFSLQNPEMLTRILIYAGAQLDPWPQANAQFLNKKFQPKAANYPPLTWIDFFIETQTLGQGKLLLSVLEEAGYIGEPSEKVKGGLSLTQVTDRLVLWAE